MAMGMEGLGPGSGQGLIAGADNVRRYAHPRGTITAWAIHSGLINTAKLNDVDLEPWLTDILERMISGRATNDRLHELLIWNWKATREAEAIRIAA